MAEMAAGAVADAITPSPKMTYEEFLDWAGEDTNAEWVNGEVVEVSPESNRHQEIALFLVTSVSLFVQARGLGVVRFERFQMKTGPEMPGREPDLLFLSNANLSRLKETYLEGPADLAVEIVSLESRERDRGAKFYEYEQGGVSEYWLIDPIRRKAEFYQLGEDGLYLLLTAGANGRYYSRALDGLWIQPDWLWQEPLPPVMGVLKEWGIV